MNLNSASGTMRHTNSIEQKPVTIDCSPPLKANLLNAPDWNFSQSFQETVHYDEGLGRLTQSTAGSYQTLGGTAADGLFPSGPDSPAVVQQTLSAPSIWKSDQDEQNFNAASISSESKTPSFEELHNLLVQARELAEGIVAEFKNHNIPNPEMHAIHVVRKGIELIKNESGDQTSKENELKNSAQGLGGPNATAPTMLAHPDEFKNPSSFLRIYDMSSKQKSTDKTGDNERENDGFWTCIKCATVNSPLALDCQSCKTIRDVNGDQTVSEYAKQIYHSHLQNYRTAYKEKGKKKKHYSEHTSNSRRFELT